MAHFAQLNPDNIVTSVIVVSNDECRNADGVEDENVGIEYCQRLFGGRWIQTSYNGSFRKHFAGVGYLYDAARDAFIPPRPFISWNFNETECIWEPPFAAPEDGLYAWNEKNYAWDLIATAEAVATLNPES